MNSVWRTYLLRLAQLAALWAYSVSQPIFSLLEENPEFLVVRGSTRAEVIVFAVVIAFGPPLLALGLERLSLLVRAGTDEILHVGFVWLFAIPLALLVVGQLEERAVLSLVAATLLAGLLALAFAKWRPVRLFLATSVVLPLFGLASFLIGIPLVSEDARGADARVNAETPVVLIVFDEFPVSSLMKSDGRLDEVRFPNFGRLARSATWYPRATTVHEHTTGAVPAILTGRLPERGQLPSLAHHPENLFTLLGESYAMRVREELTYLCPRRYCPRPRDSLGRRLVGLFGDVEVAYLRAILPESLASGLPDADDRWSGFHNTERLLVADRSTVDAVVNNRTRALQQATHDFLLGVRGDEPVATLHFAHFVLPHSPWRFLPSGLHYGDGLEVDGWDGDYMSDDDWQAARAYQRHLVQLAYTDRVLGLVLDRLQRQRLYDDALVIVVADHGASFKPGEKRRKATRATLADIARVPLFVKVPQQRTGMIDPRAVRTVDVLPTIADVLDVAIPWRVDGRSLIGGARTATVVEVRSRDREDLRASPSELDRAQIETIERKARIFGEGPRSLFDIGEHRSLLGARVDGLPVSSSNAEVRFEEGHAFRDVRKSSGFVPAAIAGTVSGELGCAGELAVVVNGRVVALTRCFAEEDGKTRFGALLPESAFRDGPNDVALYLIRDQADGVRLVLLGRPSL